MKHILLIISVIVFLSANNYAQDSKTREFNSVPYQNTIQTIKFTVLDINFDNNLVAFKHVFNLLEVYDEQGDIYMQPCDCKYTGMQENPYAGVVLGVYDLSKQEYLKTFTIYNSSYTESDCFDYETSTANLEEAKKFFAENNLDISKKPEPIPFLDDFIDIDGVTFTFTNENTINDDYTAMSTNSVLFAFVRANPDLKMPVYSIFQQDYYYMASSGEINYISAYKKGNKVVFLNKFHHINHMAGSCDSETYHFTPIFGISELKKSF
ncbi:MAG: hypothetical protein JXL97_17195 [Bacteroidales bacterium]|nr:hypothetical protein [Bacteroidales bacterium]